MASMYRIISMLLLIAVTGLFAVSAQAKSATPNILVIRDDDIGETNVSASSRGLMGYKTPNIDIMAHADWMPTVLATLVGPDIVKQLKKGGYKANGKEWRAPLHGHNFLLDSKGEWFVYPQSEYLR